MSFQPRVAPSDKAYPVLSREDVGQLIANGSKVIIVDQYVLKVDAWIKYHPGGDLAILHMVGRDATDEVNALHGIGARRKMDRYRIGRIEGHWKNFVPPIQGGVFRGTSLQEELESVASGSALQASCESSKDASSSSSSSRAPSPIFDTDGATLRKRHGEGVSSAASSADEEGDTGEMDGITYLDAQTRKEIRLDLDKYPAVDADTQNAIVEKYRQLRDRLEAEGYFKCNYREYGIEAIRYISFLALSALFLWRGHYAVSGMFLGFFWHQASFCVHDAGHQGITHNYTVDTLIGMFLSNFCGGLSLGWWKWSHNVHHIVTNSPEHDPDNQHLPFLAVNHRFFKSLYSSYHRRVMKYDFAARCITSIQAWLYYPIMAFARFNLYVQSWIYLLSGTGPRRGAAWWHRWLEFVGMAVFWTWYGYFLLYKTIPTNRDRIIFYLVSNLTTVPLHVQITLSHFAMSSSDLGPTESFAQKMLRTTMDVDCPQWLDFFHGGLQFQAIHHLFPQLPRHNLRAVQKLVLEFCEEAGIPYALYGFVDGQKHMLGHLAEVSRQGAILAKCQRTVARRGDYLHDVFSG